MRVSVLMVDGAFDSGPSTVCDVLGAANVQSVDVSTTRVHEAPVSESR